VLVPRSGARTPIGLVSPFWVGADAEALRKEIDQAAKQESSV
jgi:hypothetical protein